MSRNGWWFASAVLLVVAPGCLGGTAEEIGTSEQALSLEAVDADTLGTLAEELRTCDCVQTGRTAEDLGYVVQWGIGGGIAEDLALLVIDGAMACSAPLGALGLRERTHVISLQPLGARPDPEPAGPDKSRPDPEPASPKQSRPDPEPATGSTGGDGAKPDESRPDPEPAGGITSTVVTISL